MNIKRIFLVSFLLSVLIPYVIMSGLLFGYYQEYEKAKKLDLEFSKSYSDQIVTSYLGKISSFKESLIYSKEFTDFLITHNDFGSFTENIIYGKILDLYEGKINLIDLEIKNEKDITIFKFAPRVLERSNYRLSFSYPIMLDEQGLNSKSAIKRGTLKLNIGTQLLEQALPESTSIKGVENNLPLLTISENISFFGKHLPFMLALVGLIIALTIIIGIKFLNSNIVKPIVEIVRSLREKSNMTQNEVSTSESEIKLLKNALSNYETYLEQSKITLIKKENDAILVKVANQVAHDIRSPLAALDSILNYTTDLPSEEKSIVKLAVDRINDIANNLLNLGREKVLHPKTEMLSPIVGSIVSEKRTQYKHLKDLTIDFNLSEDNYGHFVNIVKHDLESVLSNIINNSVESLDLTQPNLIVIECSLSKGACQILVRDNGKGIPKDVIDKLFKDKCSFGKANGNGIGLYSSKEILAKYSSQIEIKSAPNEGTLVTISIPKVTSPLWFCDELKISKRKICIIDDDKSIYQVWVTKLKLLQANLEISHLASFPDKIDDDTMYLIDYEFNNQGFNGLDQIISRQITNCFLVTSHFENTSIQMKAIEHNIKIISKTFIPSLPTSFT